MTSRQPKSGFLSAALPLLAALTFAAAWATQAPASDWPQYKRDATRTGDFDANGAKEGRPLLESNL